MYWNNVWLSSERWADVTDNTRHSDIAPPWGFIRNLCWHLQLNPTGVIPFIIESPTISMFNLGEEVSGDTPQSGLIFETCFSLSVLSSFNNLSLLFKLDLLLFWIWIWLFSVRMSSLLLIKIPALIMSLLDVRSSSTFAANICSWWFFLELQEH